MLVRATSRGYSPLVLISARADGVVVATLRSWRARLGRTEKSTGS
jgi:hypothetical protein